MNEQVFAKINNALSDARNRIPIPIAVLYNKHDFVESPVYVPNLPESLYSELTGMTCTGESGEIIMLPALFFESWKSVSEEDIHIVLHHEYGHCLTRDSITEEELRSGRFKMLAMELLLVAFPCTGGKDACDAESAYFHHRLPVEQRADSASGISLDQVQKCIEHQYGVRACNRIAGADIDSLLEKKVPSSVSIEEIYPALMEFAIGIVSKDCMEHFSKTAKSFADYITNIQV